MGKLLKNKNCKENPRRIVTKIEEFQKNLKFSKKKISQKVKNFQKNKKCQEVQKELDKN